MVSFFFFFLGKADDYVTAECKKKKKNAQCFTAALLPTREPALCECQGCHLAHVCVRSARVSAIFAVISDARRPIDLNTPERTK